MMLNDDNKKDFKKMMKGRAVYLALGVCVLAAGIVSYSATLGKLTPKLRPNDETEIVTHEHTADRALPETTTIPSAPPATEPVSERTTLQPETAAAPVFENSAPTVPAAPPEETTAEAEAQQPAFTLPLSARMGDDYSMGVPVFSDTMGDYRTHNGVDFMGEAGAAVRAVAAGTVVSVASNPLYGNVVTVDHGGGIVSRICGLADEGLIEEGAAVTAESVVGLVGKLPAEEKEGSHIHLEIRRDGVLTDPLAFFDLRAAED